MVCRASRLCSGIMQRALDLSYVQSESEDAVLSPLRRGATGVT